MCEDIASYSYDRKDFDYNDVVFDAIIYENQYVLVTSTLDNSGNVTNVSGTYVNVVKPAIDKALSFMGLIVLSPVFLLISLAIFH